MLRFSGTLRHQFPRVYMGFGGACFVSGPANVRFATGAFRHDTAYATTTDRSTRPLDAATIVASRSEMTNITGAEGAGFRRGQIAGMTKRTQPSTPPRAQLCSYIWQRFDDSHQAGGPRWLGRVAE